MLKTKKTIIIIFIIYLTVSFVINGIKTYDIFELDKIYSYSTEELREEFQKEIKKEYKNMPEEKNKYLTELDNMTDEEINKKMKEDTSQLWIILIIWTLILTLIRNFIPIIVFVVAIITNKKLRKSKLNKDDFFKSKNYYRDILGKSGMCELAWIDNFKVEQKDVIAELLQLENKKIITIDENKIIVNKKYDKTKLRQSQQYILNNIKNNKMNNINESKLIEKIKEDALQDGLIEKKNDLKIRLVKQIIISVVIFIIAQLVKNLIFNSLSSLGDNTIMVFIIFAILIIIALYPIIAIISFIITAIRFKMDPYFRTEKGKSLNRDIEGLKKFLEDYTLLDEKDKEAVVVWEEYLAYSVLFDQNKKIVEQYKNIWKNN